MFSGYNEASICMHVASFLPGWVNRDLLWATFSYPFEQLGVKKVIGQVPASNKAALEFDTNLGFKIETIVKDVFVDDDLVVLGMYRDECRWLKIKPRHIF